MLFLADANGTYAIVQSDTVIVGTDPHFAVGNWRMACNTDMDAVPITRLQQGRTLLAEGVEPTLDGALSVLKGMRSCREFLGNGTFFSTLFDPVRGQAHLYFYHDFEHPVTFDLRTELAKGAHTLDLPIALPAERRIPSLAGLPHAVPPAVDLLELDDLGRACGVARSGVWRGRAGARVQALDGEIDRRFLAPGPVGLGMVRIVGLVGVLLMQEGVVYFGLGDVHPALAFLPYILLLIALGLFSRSERRKADRWATLPALLLLAPVLIGCAYWGFFW